MSIYGRRDRPLYINLRISRAGFLTRGSLALVRINNTHLWSSTSQILNVLRAGAWRSRVDFCILSDPLYTAIPDLKLSSIGNSPPPIISRSTIAFGWLLLELSLHFGGLSYCGDWSYGIAQ
jgi:hypothetical protein